MEVTLCYTRGNPEEGETDTLTVGVTKLRWSIAATRECEQKNGLYYYSFVSIVRTSNECNMPLLVLNIFVSVHVSIIAFKFLVLKFYVSKTTLYV